MRFLVTFSSDNRKPYSFVVQMHSFRGLFFAFSFLNDKWGISGLESFRLDGNCPFKSVLRERERFPVRHPMPQVNSLSQSL